MIRKSITLLAFLSITVLVISGLKSLADTADGEDITALSDAVPTEYVEVPKDLSAIELIADEIPDVTDDAIEKELDVYRGYTKVLEEVTDRDTVEIGDIVNIDYIGKVEGNAFEGGTASGCDLEIGSEQFMEGFEESLIGAQKASTIVIVCQFPNEYFDTELAGKEAEFEVTVNKIQKYVTPEFTDETVANIGLVDTDENPITTVDGLRQYIRSNLQKQKDYYEKYEIQDKAITALLENTTVKKGYSETMREDAADRVLVLNGLSADSVTAEERESYKAYAEDYITQLLAVRAVAENENLTVTEEEVLDYIHEIMGEDADSFIERTDETGIQAYEDQVLRKKVAEAIVRAKKLFE